MISASSHLIDYRAEHAEMEALKQGLKRAILWHFGMSVNAALPVAYCRFAFKNVAGLCL